jgi:hypothetical protein
MGLLGDGRELVWAPTERERVLASSKSRVFLNILGASIGFFGSGLILVEIGFLSVIPDKKGHF